MKLASAGLVAVLVFLATACGTSSTTVTGPSPDRCAITAAHSMASVGASGGSGRLTVTAARECTWSVASSASWITFSTPAGGQGDGTVDYVVAANPSTEERRGGLVVGGQTLQVVQTASACQFQLQPSNQDVGADGGSGSFSVSTPSTCSWSASTSQDWISIATGGAQSGNGTVNFSVAANTGRIREGAITVGGQVFAILQSAPACLARLSAAGLTVDASGGTGSVNVTMPPGCAWTTSSSAPWVSITSGASGTSNGTVSFTVQANAEAARNATLTIGGQLFTITQLQAACNYSINPSSQAFPAGGGPGSVSLSTSSICTWNTSGVPSWVTGIFASATGPETMNFTVAANTGIARNADIVIGGQTFSVTQADGCTYSLAPSSHNPSAAGGASSFAITTDPGCGWTTSGVPGWITGVPASGSGPQSINFTVDPNTGPSRSATISAGGQTFAVTQLAGCTYSLNPTSHNASSAGGASSFDVNTAAGCNWTTTASSVPSWITGIPGSGSGTTTINFTVASHSGTARSANITVAGQTFAVSQESGCAYSLNPTSHNASSAGGASSFDVNTAAGCNWTTTASSVPSWITGIPGSGSGTTTINFTVAANTGSPRSANITVAGQTFAVSQASGCTYSLSPSNHNAPSGGGPSSFDVNTSAGCNWTTTASSVPAWITGIPPSGSGTTTINFTVAANTGSPRSANIDIAGQTFAVSQASGCTYSLNPTSHNATAGGGNSSVDVTTAAGCAWTTSGVPSWVTGIPSNGTGTTTINFTVGANTQPARNANITIAGRTFAVSQASGCTYSVSPDDLDFDASGQPSQSVSITTGMNCPWNAVANDSWLNIAAPASGTGSGTINISADPYIVPFFPRSGSVTIGGQIIDITQTAP